MPTRPAVNADGGSVDWVVDDILADSEVVVDVDMAILLLVDDDASDDDDEGVVEFWVTLLAPEGFPIEGSVRGMKVPVDDARLGVGTTRGDERGLHEGLVKDGCPSPCGILLMLLTLEMCPRPGLKLDSWDGC